MKNRPLIISAVTTVVLLILLIILLPKMDRYMYYIYMGVLSLSGAFFGNQMGKKLGVKQIKISKLLTYLLCVLSFAGLIFCIESLLNIEALIKIWSVIGILFIGGVLLMAYILKKGRV